MGNTLIKISVWYFLIGVTLGLYMSMAHSYILTGVHVHVNLLGWASLALAGVIYHLNPHLTQTTSAKIHFWLHNLGLPIMMGGLTLMLLGAGEVFLTFVAIGGVVTVLGIYFFGYNILKNLSRI